MLRDFANVDRSVPYQLREMMPLARFGALEDIAEAVAFLASQGAA
jgi:NAD(P)-dependent dehydrogenase (short-subunit alcohol dehydrogenase family)